MRRGELAEMMAAVAAEVRLARFLLQLSRRMAECGQSPRRFHLRMSRRDIASYLGVAHETVSRSFGALARWGWLRVDNREVEILDLPGLKQFALNTRRAVDDGPHRRRSPSCAVRVLKLSGWTGAACWCGQPHSRPTSKLEQIGLGGAAFAVGLGLSGSVAQPTQTLRSPP